MNTSGMANFIKKAKITVIKHGPEILTGIGVAGMITSTVLAVKATPKALKLIDEKKKELDVEKLPPVETVKATWKCYIPAAISGAASVTCIIGASSVSAKRNAALATAYALSETALTEYRSKVVETLGEKKDEAVMHAVAKDKIEKTPIDKQHIIFTNNGETLFLDILSGRHFKSDINKVQQAVNSFNESLLKDDCLPLNEFYYYLGLPETKLGESMGWNIEGGLIDIYRTPHLIEINGEDVPCIAINYRVPPKYGYDKF